MGILRFNYRSEALGKFVDITMTFPTDNYSFYTDASPKKPRISHGENHRPLYREGMKLQTLYLIHGGGDDDSVPYRYTNVERYAIANNVMTVTPDLSNSFGADTEYGVDYNLFLTEELPKVVQSLFASSPCREDNFIIGFAMGGNVALSAAIRRPDRYAVCVDMSGGIGYTLNTEGWKQELSGEHFKNHFYLHNATFGPAEALEGSRHDLLKIAREKKVSGEPLSDFIVIAGSEEGFIRDRVEQDVRILKELGYPVRYECVPGGKHDMELWDRYLKIVLDEMLPLKRKPGAEGEERK